MKINLAHNWSFKHLKWSDIHKKRPIVPPPTPYPQKWTVKLCCLSTSSRIYKHMTNFKTYPIPPFNIDIINVYSLCYGKYITQVKDGPSFIKFLKSVFSSYTIHIHLSCFLYTIYLLLVAFVVFQSFVDI